MAISPTPAEFAPLLFAGDWMAALDASCRHHGSLLRDGRGASMRHRAADGRAVRRHAGTGRRCRRTRGPSLPPDQPSNAPCQVIRLASSSQPLRVISGPWSSDVARNSAYHSAAVLITVTAARPSLVPRARTFTWALPTTTSSRRPHATPPDCIPNAAKTIRAGLTHRGLSLWH